LFSHGAAYVRGKFVPIAEATIPVTDWGLTRSDAVYDVVHVFRGGFFRLDDHLDRFLASMQARRLSIPEDRAAIEAVLHKLVGLAGLQDAYVSMATLRGRPTVAGSRRPQDCENHLVAFAVPWVDVIPQAVQDRGAKLWIAETPRVPDASVNPVVKNYQWSDLTSGLFEAHDNGHDTAVLCDADGLVTEGPGFNIFIVKDGVVSTPDRGSLHGITRATVLDLCKAMQIDASVTAIPRALLETADEVFATTTAGGPMRIADVAGKQLGDGKAGPVFTAIRDAYWRLHEAGEHVTPVRPLADSVDAGGL